MNTELPPSLFFSLSILSLSLSRREIRLEKEDSIPERGETRFRSVGENEKSKMGGKGRGKGEEIRITKDSSFTIT